MANLRANRITSTEVFETTGSVQFDGSGDYLSAGSIGDWDFLHNGSTDWTISYWLYPSIENSRQTILSTGGASGTIGFATRIMESGNLGSSNGYYISAQISRGVGGSYIYWDSDPVRLTNNRWYNISLVFKASNKSLSIYLDGELTNGINDTGSGSIGYSSSNSGYSLNIGREPYTDILYYTGHISNLRVLKGTALYTSNFTPPIRELEVIPNTVLLACQSTTKADEEKTGKTITVNGNAVANELTPGLLTNVVKSGGSSAITGSVEFDGTGDYLELADSDDFDVGSGDFTFEFWVNPGRTTRQTLFTQMNSAGQNASSSFYVEINSSAQWRFIAQQSTTSYEINAGTVTANEWTYLAYARNGNTATLYVNGVSVGTVDLTGVTVNNSSEVFSIGRYPGGLNFAGFISNFRMVKGTALYTSNFIPPTSKLKNLPGTVLLCCQDNESVTTEATGKTITANGNPAARRFTPSVGNDGSVEFAGPTTINTENYFYLPTGPTEQRGRGRGVFGAGNAPTKVNSIDYIEIQTLGNAQDFGDLIDSFTPGQTASLSSTTRGLFGGGNTPTVVNTIQYITIATTSNASDFGDLTETKWSSSGCSSSTRGIVAGGRTPSFVNSIDYVTIQSTGNAQEFGDLTQVKNELGAASSPTRGIFMGGQPGSGRLDRIEYITIATTGNASVFGTLGASRNAGASVSNQTRALFAGGVSESPTLVAVNTIEYITIASTGNASDFGDLILARYGQGGCSNSIRGVFAGEEAYPTPAVTNTIQYITIASTGNAQDFGDLTVATFFKQGLSDSHGGLG